MTGTLYRWKERSPASQMLTAKKRRSELPRKNAENAAVAQKALPIALPDFVGKPLLQLRRSVAAIDCRFYGQRHCANARCASLILSAPRSRRVLELTNQSFPRNPPPLHLSDAPLVITCIDRRILCLVRSIGSSSSDPSNAGKTTGFETFLNTLQNPAGASIASPPPS